MLNANDECQYWMPILIATTECQCWSLMGVQPQIPKSPKEDPKWVQNDRQVLRIGPRESYGCSEAFGMGLAHSMFFLPPACVARRLVNIQGWKSPPRAGTSKASGKV